MLKIKKQIIIDTFGWYGMVAILVSYGMISFGILSNDNLLYQLLNLTGALGILSVSISKKATQPALLNAAWVLIAFLSVLIIIF